MDNIFLIDNHIHGSFGINFNYSNYIETKFVLKELYKRNIRGICPTLVGEDCKKIQNQLALFKKIKQEQTLKTCEKESLILGVHLEGTFLNPDKSGIQDKEVFLVPNINNYKKLVGDYGSIVKIVTLAPELDEDLIDYLLNKNIKPQAGHTLGEELKNCCATTHHFNAMNPIHHRNKSIALQGLLKDNYIELIADLIHCSRDILSLVLKIKPKNRIMLISDSLPSSNYNKDIIFCNKKINKKGQDEKGTLAGSNQTLDTIVDNLVNKKILTKEDIIQMGFKNQISYLNLNDKEIDILNK